MKIWHQSRTLTFLAALFLCIVPNTAGAYSVFTHEALVDLTWWTTIRPLLLERYPGLTPTQLREARAYAYGGCVIQDLGYYPFGKPIFSDLLHYVRTGDFIRALFRDSKNADDTAFALGALSHYYGDTIGHPDAINRAVGIGFPALAAKYGPNVNYAEGPHQHVETEFAFDINDILKHRTAPERYLNHIGFEVPRPVLARAFYETYGLPLSSVMNRRRPTFRGYRYSVRTLLPRVAYAEAILYRHRMHPDAPSPELDNLNAQIAALAVSEKWELYRSHAGLGTHLLAGFIFILPKFGPLADLKLRPPSDVAERDYVVSFLKTAVAFNQTIAASHTSGHIPNLDLDTGDLVRPGTYPLEDKAYADLLHSMTRTPSQPIPFAIKRDLLSYFADLSKVKYIPAGSTLATQVQADLVILHTIPTGNEDPDQPLFLDPSAN